MKTPKIIGETKVVLGPVRLSFPSLFEKKKFDGDTGDGKYMASLMIPKDEKETVDALNKAIDNARRAGITSKWGNKTPKKLDLPLRDGDEMEDEHMAGHWIVRAKSNSRPTVVDRKGALITDPEEIYGGVWCDMSISLFAYSTAGNNGVGCALNQVRKFKDDEPFGAGGGDDFADFNDDDLSDEDL